MAQPTIGQRFFCTLACWSAAAITGITIAVVAVGLLGLWVAVGAVGAVVGTLATGAGLQFLFCTDLDALAEARQERPDPRQR